jgi:predicted secreted Zn-dependent protease
VKQFSGWQIAILAMLLVCVCCTFAGVGIVGLAYVAWDQGTPTRAQAIVTSTRAVATTGGVGAPSLTRTPTRIANPYQVIIPTPGAPTTLYPIAFDSRLTIATYNVAGKTVNEISKSLESNAMPDPNEPGSRYYALTKWHLASDWSVRPSLRGCDVTTGTVTVMLTMTLPLLTSSGVPTDTHNRFDTFIEKTVQHESGHVEITLQGAREYQRALGNYPAAPNCDALNAQLNDLFRQHFDSIQRANREYDAKTKHGRTQGAVFP